MFHPVHVVNQNINKKQKDGRREGGTVNQTMSGMSVGEAQAAYDI